VFHCMRYYISLAFSSFKNFGITFKVVMVCVLNSLEDLKGEVEVCTSQAELEREKNCEAIAV